MPCNTRHCFAPGVAYVRRAERRAGQNRQVSIPSPVRHVRAPRRERPAASFVRSLPIGDRALHFLREVEQGGLRPVFQPVVALGSGDITGHELLTQRAGGPGLHAAAMFVAAAGVGAGAPLAIRCIEMGIDRYRAATGNARLFVKLPPSGAVLLAASLDGFVDWLRERATAADRVVIELMEYEAADTSTDIETAVLKLRKRGFGIALNSLGAGIGTTRLWLDLQPDYVKLDGYFTQGICRDSRRLRFVESMLRVGEQLGTTLIAHALETEADLRVVRDLGVPLAQGYVIAMPDAEIAECARRRRSSARARRTGRGAARAGDRACQRRHRRSAAGRGRARGAGNARHGTDRALRGTAVAACAGGGRGRAAGRTGASRRRARPGGEVTRFRGVSDASRARC